MSPLGCHPQQSQAAWTPPSTSCFKVNFDGATFEKEGSAGLGVVIRNGDGQVMASLSQLVPLPHSVIEVEALAARRGVELAPELSFYNIELEGDLTGLISSLNDGHRSLAQYGHIVTDIHYLASQFFVFNLSRVRRHCNKVAHSLARRGLISSPLSIWMEDVPPNVTHVPHADLSTLP